MFRLTCASPFVLNDFTKMRHGVGGPVVQRIENAKAPPGMDGRRLSGVRAGDLDSGREGRGKRPLVNVHDAGCVPTRHLLAGSLDAVSLSRQKVAVL
jgi:hypothetical protein